MSDDWGTQQNSIVSYDFWMDFFYPRYKRIFDAMHRAGCDLWVHSCGKVNDIIEGYIQAGVDVADENVKPFMYDTFSTWSDKIYGQPLPSIPAGLSMEPSKPWRPT